MKKRIMAWVLALCMGVPVCAGAAQEQEVYGYPTEDALRKLPKTVTRGDFLEALASASGEDVSDSAWIDMEEYFTDGVEASDEVKWTFAKWILNGAAQDGEKAVLRLDDLITRQEAAALLGRYLDYRYTALPAGCGTGSPDPYNIAEWAQNGVSKCWMYGVIDMSDESNVSYPDGTTSSALDFRPNDLVAGSEAAQWIANANALDMSAVAAPEKPGFADALIRAVDAEGNWSLSPYSIRMCLAMLANGTKGETQRELLDDLQIEDLEAFNQTVKEQLATYDGYARIMSLETANSLWINQSWFDGAGEFLPDYAREMDEYFRAVVEEVTNADSVERVNAWADEKTHGKIPTILTEDNREFVTALINAVYFKAAWEKEFSPAHTEKADFTNADGTAGTVDMMHQTDVFGYYSTPGVEALRMDYRKYAVDNWEGDNWKYFRDADFSMYLIKADDELDVQNLLDNAEFTHSDVRVSIPRFKVEYGAPLDEALQALGVRTAYEPEKADLTAMLDPSELPARQHFLDTVVHKTYVAVDEKGTEAAAVTAAMDGAGAALPSRPELVRTFTADEPFWFVIRDNANGEILFAGRYETAN
ncbi:serpin family protein [Agathobaculum massiliense]|uniref:serpin family protein n=1 Tax=Agathobaculum massiliense TaxID=3014267 RepID=UPI00131EAEE1|nr:serpin family protein [Agathobaculum massiliense]